MPKAKEKQLEDEIYTEYRKKKFGEERARYIAKATVYGRRRRKSTK